MQIKKILYVGEDTGNSLCRLNAMKRLGFNVDAVTPRNLLPKISVVEKLLWKTGGWMLTPIVNYKLKAFLAKQSTYDLIWVNAGDYLYPSSIRLLKKHAHKIVNYTTDDPYGGRDGIRHDGYLKCIPLYDLIAVTRMPNVEEAYQLGAKKVVFHYMTADEVEHRPRNLTDGDREQYRFEVLFLGTWFPERGPFMKTLIDKGVPLTIIGPRWDKAPEWEALKSSVRGTGLYGDAYAKAIQNSRICLGLLSKGNRDEHTTRSMEIPALGSVLCAERTSEHEALYIENEEAVFWSSAEECAEKCLELLHQPDVLKSIALNGHKKVKENKSYNEDMIKSVISGI